MSMIGARKHVQCICTYNDNVFFIINCFVSCLKVYYSVKSRMNFH